MAKNLSEDNEICLPLIAGKSLQRMRSDFHFFAKNLKNLLVS
jgi:hypothetical protein